MGRGLSRRKAIAVGAAAASGAALAALGIEAWPRSSTGSPPLSATAVGGSPTAQLPTATATATIPPTETPLPPTATSTATPPPPTATPTPYARPSWLPGQMRQVVYSVRTDAPLVALTLDDGWSERSRVLDTVLAQHLQLTFFLTGGAVRTDRAFIAEALNAGMEIGNHTMDHADLTLKSVTAIQQDLADFEALVAAAVPGATTHPYMRPPGGAVNQVVADASAAVGYRPINWSSSSGDGSASTTPDQMVANALSRAVPGAIILMHFGPRALVAIPPLVQQLRAKGLEPVSLSRLFAAAQGT